MRFGNSGIPVILFSGVSKRKELGARFGESEVESLPERFSKLFLDGMRLGSAGRANEDVSFSEDSNCMVRCGFQDCVQNC
jgi:hypothetical protein